MDKLEGVLQRQCLLEEAALAGSAKPPRNHSASAASVRQPFTGSAARSAFTESTGSSFLIIKELNSVQGEVQNAFG